MHILSLDQGTTSSRAIVFDASARTVAVAQREHPQLFPAPGHVEHDPEQIWKTQLGTARQALRRAGVHAAGLAALGITNQRETIVLWERSSGTPLGNAIVWQSRITAPLCERLERSGLGTEVRERTGLRLDPYFSGTKIKHLLDADRGLRRRARRGEILCGTIDCFLLWRLTGGRVHATDFSNASRTLLFNIHTLDWDPVLLDALDVPREMLPEVRDSSGVFGETDRKLLGHSVPIAGIAGDQQAATFGQGCFRRGAAKNTYGTGCFLLMNTGTQPVASRHGLLTTIGWGLDGRATYCLEGSVFVAGAAVQWLRDGLGLIRRSSDIEALAASVEDNGGVYFVPAFVGLGSPHWDPYARGTIVGLTRGSTVGHLARAAIEAMAFQSADLVTAMEGDAGTKIRRLRVDGGASTNDALMQFQADVLGTTVERPRHHESTALGAAFLAGLATGVFRSTAALSELQPVERTFRPALARRERTALLRCWRHAVERSRGWAR
ncbi:MAG: glycerol kinase GlpK [Planctomycetes bacterium]|nr:glycerol kinase GlpK [Planctomycetota bacterium]MCB9869094.1 glycerol kinase GlpK [Planctomycetota bacterium]MCB9889267.1 glycerol kinase GlpK [Planctomycetota bacterium]